jgi:hypothetical protein
MHCNIFSYVHDRELEVLFKAARLRRCSRRDRPSWIVEYCRSTDAIGNWDPIQVLTGLRHIFDAVTLLIGTGAIVITYGITFSIPLTYIYVYVFVSLVR